MLLFRQGYARHRGVKVNLLVSVVSVVFGKGNILVLVPMVKLAEV